MQPLVSVVIPTHNRANMITRAMESILHQTYDNWEMFVVDDCSTDETLAKVKPYLNDQRIQYLRMEQRSGACAARNKGIEYAKGEFITFLDSDDEYLPRKIELQVKCFQESKIPNVGVISCGREDYRNGIKYFEWIPKIKGNIVNNLLQKDRVGAGTPFLMTRRDILIQHNILFDPEMPAGQDWDFLIRVSRHVAFDFVPQALVRVYHHSNERIYTNDRAILAVEKQYNKYRHLLVQNARIHDRFVLKMAVMNYVYGHSDTAVQLLQNKVFNKSFKTSLWTGCIKAFPKYGTLSSKVVHKLLNAVF